MAVTAAFREYVVDLFAPFGVVTTRLMFGAGGVYYRDVIIGVIDEDKIYLKTDTETRPLFEKERMKPFSFTDKAGNVVETGYFEVPAKALDDAEALKAWARLAYEASMRKRGKKKPAKKAGLPRDLPILAPKTRRKR